MDKDHLKVSGVNGGLLGKQLKRDPTASSSKNTNTFVLYCNQTKVSLLLSSIQ